MADKGPSALTAASALSGTEVVHLIQSSNSRKSTAQDIANLATGLAIADTTGLQAALDAKLDDSQAGAGGLSVLGAADATAVRAAAGCGTVSTLASDIDGTLAANSDVKVATQKATKTYVDTAVAGATGTYTDEKAQDAIGAMIDSSLTYVDVTPLLQRAALTGDVTASAGSNTTVVANANYSATLTATGTPPTNAIGYLGCPQNTQNGTYTTVLTDAGKHIYHTSGSAHTWTIDSNANVAYPIGTILTFVNENGGGNVTLAITSDTLRWGSSTGSRTLAANGTATALKVASTTWRLTGDGIT